jgi:hypothetical protein
MQVKGKFRIGYLIQCTVIVIVFLIPIILFLKDDGTDSTLNSNRFWFGVVGFVWLFGGALFFVHKDIFFINISNEGMTFTTIFGKTLRYKYYDLLKIDTTSASLKRRYYSSPGYQIVTITFRDGKSIDISANVYANFEKIKSEIYKHFYPT